MGERPRLRDRVWSFKAMLHVAAATLIVGGLTGAGITAVAGDDREDRRWPPQLDHTRPGPDGPPGAPPEGRRPWQHEHFYWDDGPTPTAPPRVRPPPSG